jgi:transposase
VSPADIFEVEFLDAEIVSAPRSLPARVAPIPDEALASWLLRFAEPFGVSPEALLLGDGEIGLTRHPDWWRKPDPLVVAALVHGTGVSRELIRSLSFNDWADDGHDDAVPERFSRQRFTAERPSHQTGRIGVCPDCFAEDEAPYVRRTWTLGWLAACPRHGTLLVRACPQCGAKLRLPALSCGEHFAPDRCRRCAHRLTRMATLLAPKPVLRFQRRMIESRPAGVVDLPEIGKIGWPVAAALFDALLGTVWIDTKQAARDVLFARIARDLSTAPLGEPADSYQSLAILAWMFEAWPARTQAALAMLHAVRPRRQMLRWPNLDPATRDKVGALFLTAWPDERNDGERGWWRAWIDNLPQTGEELRAQAVRERLPHRRARLVAIADVREGLSVEAAAEVADVLPRTLYRWIKRGARGGLEAALERPSGQLSGLQAAQLAEWIAAASPDEPRWRVNRVQNEALRRFRAEITIYVADRLLRMHGPWRRRRILLRRRLTVAPVYD